MAPIPYPDQAGSRARTLRGRRCTLPISSPRVGLVWVLPLPIPGNPDRGTPPLQWKFQKPYVYQADVLDLSSSPPPQHLTSAHSIPDFWRGYGGRGRAKWGMKPACFPIPNPNTSPFQRACEVTWGLNGLSERVGRGSLCRMV